MVLNILCVVLLLNYVQEFREKSYYLIAKITFLTKLQQKKCVIRGDGEWNVNLSSIELLHVDNADH